MFTHQQPDAFDDVQHRVHYLTSLHWHIGAFLSVNALLWLLDFGLGQSGLQWAYWITIPWLLVLIVHALTYQVDGRQIEDRRIQDFVRRSRDSIRRSQS